MPSTTPTPAGDVSAFLDARDFLLRAREDHDGAVAKFRWPALTSFNWALDYFDPFARGNDQRALWVVDGTPHGQCRTYSELSLRSSQLANYFRSAGVERGDRVLVMLGNVPALWEAFLAAMKLGAVIIPATTLLGREELVDRLERGAVRHVVTEAAHTAKLEGVPGSWARHVVGEADGWQPLTAAEGMRADFAPDGPTMATDPLLLYFTSGTTSKPKLVEHTHQSYPVGHLSTMFWLGLRPGDLHLNLSSPGWAKHAWSNLFAPWNAGATVVALSSPRFDAELVLDALVRAQVTTFCAPPTVWRMLIQHDLAAVPVVLRELLGAGEPLNPEVIEQVRSAWGITIRDGFGQTETTAQIGNSPGLAVRPGSMGKPLPGYDVVLVGPDGQPGDEGEICLELTPRPPLGLMAGYRDDEARTAEAMAGGRYHTGDVARRDRDGYLTYVGRADDVFKASDYRISPFELESVLIEHEAVAEAAVVPSPDPVRLAVPKAYVVLADGWVPSGELAASILEYGRQRLAPFKRIRRIEFHELPKTISGKIRRVELRQLEQARPETAERRHHEYWEEDFAR